MSCKKDDEASEKGPSSAARNNRKKKKKSGLSLFTILLYIAMISGFSTVVGALFTWFTGMYLADSNITGNAQTNILFIVFLSSFVIAAIPMAIVFLGKESDD